jgi:hypothetical protein
VDLLLGIEMAFSPSSWRSVFLPPLPLRIYRQLHAASVSGFVKGSVNDNVMFMTVLATGLCGA